MKDFTQIKYIEPVLNEISEKYVISHNTPTTQYFNCDLTLETPYEIGTIYIVSRNKDFYIPCIESLDALIDEILDYTLCAETYPGELEKWQSDEVKRVYKAVRNALIENYGG